MILLQLTGFLSLSARVLSLKNSHLNLNYVERCLHFPTESDVRIILIQI